MIDCRKVVTHNFSVIDLEVSLKFSQLVHGREKIFTARSSLKPNSLVPKIFGT